MLIAYWLILVVVYYNESKQSRSYPVSYTGRIVRSIPVYLVLTMQCIRQVGLQITWYYQVPWANPVLQ